MAPAVNCPLPNTLTCDISSMRPFFYEWMEGVLQRARIPRGRVAPRKKWRLTLTRCREPQSLAAWSLRLFWHRRQLPCAAKGVSGRGAILAQDALQQELEGRHSMDDVPPDHDAISIVAIQAVSFISGAVGYRYAVTRIVTSVVREIRTLRSVGAGGA